MADVFELDAEVRNDRGKGASRRLRRLNGKVPGIVYGAGRTPENISLETHKVRKALENEAFYSHILMLKVAGKAEKVILKDLQRHPYKLDVLHMDFQRVKAGEKITKQVPIHFVGEDTEPNVGIFSHQLNEVEITCLPEHLPEFLELDISELELDGVLHLSDIKLPEGVQIVALSHGNEHDLPVGSMHLPRAALEETDEAAGDAENKDA